MFWLIIGFIALIAYFVAKFERLEREVKQIRAELDELRYRRN